MADDKRSKDIGGREKGRQFAAQQKLRVPDAGLIVRPIGFVVCCARRALGDRAL